MIPKGVYPTMITPYKNGEIDYAAVDALVAWYKKYGCQGIFAVCQSSEMQFLSLDERVELARRVVKAANGEMAVVASGHCSESIDAQAEEINRIAETGIDAFVWVTNRLDLHNDGDGVWIANAEKLLSKIDPDLPLGIYECPAPYKRLLTPKVLDWCIKSKRFTFIKDTCCDPNMLTARLEQLKDSGILLFNANSQTMLHSLQQGAAGFSGILANMHPDLYVWLCDNWESQPEKAQWLADCLSITGCTDLSAYPSCAKYYLGFEGVAMDTYSRSCDPKRLTDYQKMIMQQLYRISCDIRKEL